MVDVSNVKAGKYELVALRWDEITSKPGEPFDFIRHRRGDIVELNVEEARRLVSAGAVMKPGERERAEAERARQAYEAALRLVPDGVRRPDEDEGSDGSADVPPDFDPDDPGQYGVKEVQAFLDTAADVDRERVYTAEAAGKNRKGIVEYGPQGTDGS